MTKIIAILFILLGFIINICAQNNPLFEAHNYWEKKDYCNALAKYEDAMKIKELANYPYYYAAQSACQCNKPEAALNYAIKSFTVYADFHNYEFFANDKLNSCFSNAPEWKKILGELKPKFDEFNLKSENYQKSVNDASLRLTTNENSEKSLSEKLQKLSPDKLVKFIKNYKDYKNPPKTDHWTLYQIKNATGEEVPFLLYVPKNYTPTEAKSLVVFLHGGVGNRPQFSSDGWIPYFEKGSLEYLQNNNSFIIYPFGKKGFNWLNTADCFETLSKQIRFARTLYNIDDNRVFIGGHSDGATGSFWFAINNRTDFAAFYGFAQMPRTFLGKFFVSNLANEQKLFSLNGAKDSLYKFEQVSQIHEKAKTVNANWRLDAIKDGDHNFMGDYPSEVANFYAELLKEKRNPLPKQITWQTDSENAKSNFWLKATKLSSSEPAKISAKYAANVFEIESVGAKELQILIPFGLVDYKKEIKVLVNQKEVIKGKIKIDKNTIIEDFLANRDREFLITNKLNVVIGDTIKNQKLADEINKMYELDQSVQTDLIEAFQSGASKEKIAEVEKIKSETFKNHIPILKKIIAENGYPTYDLVGKKAGDNFFTLIQHSDTDLQFQKDCLKIIAKLVKKKQANGKSFAFLTDRVNINSGKPQIYGSQLDYKDGQAVSKNLKDPKKVNKRRAELGLEPLEDYLKMATEFHQKMNKKN